LYFRNYGEAIGTVKQIKMLVSLFYSTVYRLINNIFLYYNMINNKLKELNRLLLFSACRYSVYFRCYSYSQKVVPLYIG